MAKTILEFLLELVASVTRSSITKSERSEIGQRCGLFLHANAHSSAAPGNMASLSRVSSKYRMPHCVAIKIKMRAKFVD